MIGDQFELFGTDNILEITGDKDRYWEVTIKSSSGKEIDILIAKQDLNDSLVQGSLSKM